MSKIVVAIAQKTELSEQQVELFLDALSSYVVQSLKAGVEVLIPELVTFSFKDVGERFLKPKLPMVLSR